MVNRIAVWQGMNASKVYFIDMHTELDDSLPNKFDRLIDAAGIGNIDLEKKFVAIKTHFGELGNLAFLRPNYSKVISDRVTKQGGIPFLTDCSTLYVGSRKNAVEHLYTANLNGFNTMSAGCQIIIGDGLKGDNDTEIPIDGEYFSAAKIGREIADADALITLSHFKCHELTAFGGALKNIGMGCASRRGKMELHSSDKPVLNRETCKGCEKCLKVCAHSAISMIDKKAFMDREKCVGCGRCISACAFNAISGSMNEASDILNRKIVEYAAAVLKDRPSFHTTIITDVSPFCDCHKENDVPVVPNVGMLASSDPVALDRASVDLVQAQPMTVGSRLFERSKGIKPDDIFKCIHPDTRWQSVFEHADKIGLGSSNYKLTKIK